MKTKFRKAAPCIFSTAYLQFLFEISLAINLHTHAPASISKKRMGSVSCTDSVVLYYTTK
jgi:hypothetical protein